MGQLLPWAAALPILPVVGAGGFEVAAARTNWLALDVALELLRPCPPNRCQRLRNRRVRRPPRHAEVAVQSWGVAVGAVGRPQEGLRASSIN